MFNVLAVALFLKSLVNSSIEGKSKLLLEKYNINPVDFLNLSGTRFSESINLEPSVSTPLPTLYLTWGEGGRRGTPPLTPFGVRFISVIVITE